HLVCRIDPRSGPMERCALECSVACSCLPNWLQICSRRARGKAPQDATGVGFTSGGVSWHEPCLLGDETPLSHTTGSASPSGGAAGGTDRSPCEAPSGVRPMAATQPEARPGAARAIQPRLLIAEDNELVGRQLKTCLEADLNVRVDTVRDGRE